MKKLERTRSIIAENTGPQYVGREKRENMVRANLEMRAIVLSESSENKYNSTTQLVHCNSIIFE